MSSEDLVMGQDWSRSDVVDSGLDNLMMHWLDNLVVHGCSEHGLFLNDFLDNSADMDLGLHANLLRSDFSMLTDWGQDMLLGHERSEVSRLSGADSNNGLVMVNHRSSSDNSRPGFNNLGIGDDGSRLMMGNDGSWGWSMNNGLVDGRKNRLWKGWKSWLDDLASVSSDNRLGLVMNGLLDGHGNVSHGRSNSNSLVDGRSNDSSRPHDGSRLDSNGSMLDSNGRGQVLSRSRDVLVDSSRSGESHRGYAKDDEGVHLET